MQIRLGVDIGGVIVDGHVGRGEEGFFHPNHLLTPQMDGAFAALRQIATSRCGHRVYLISTARPHVETKLREWLEANRCYEETGVVRSHVRFCVERSQKAAISAELELTHFIDDRLQVLGSLVSVPHRYLFRPRPEEVQRYAHFASDKLTRVDAWHEVLNSFANFGILETGRTA